MQGFRVVFAPLVGSDTGVLSFFEKGKEIDFDIKRIYYIHQLPKEERRGFHAHRQLKQVLFCPWGSVEVLLKDGIGQETVLLDRPEKLLILQPGLWREFTVLMEGSVLCVGASDIYDENDYIRDYSEYLKWSRHE